MEKKIITTEQINGLMQLLYKYNIGVSDFSNIEKMFSSLEIVQNKQQKNEDKK